MTESQELWEQMFAAHLVLYPPLNCMHPHQDPEVVAWGGGQSGEEGMGDLGRSPFACPARDYGAEGRGVCALLSDSVLVGQVPDQFK